MFKKVFIINGSGGCGKDTFVKFVSKCVPTMNYSSVQPIKNIAKHLGWNFEKTDKSRKMLSELKKIATEYNDMPFEETKKKINYFMNDETHIFLFIHIREPEEIQRVVNAYKDDFEIKTILIKNDYVEKISSNNSDKNVDNYDYDYVLPNNGTLDDLKETARLFTMESVIDVIDTGF